MKRLLFTTLAFFAILLALSFTVMPHHHHGNMACLVLESCDINDKTDDVHHEHHPNEAGNNEICSIDSGYFSTKSKDDNHCEFSCCDRPEHLIPVICLFNCFCPAGDNETSFWPFREFVEVYLSVYTGHGSGLRAPPCLFLS